METRTRCFYQDLCVLIAAGRPLCHLLTPCTRTCLSAITAVLSLSQTILLNSAPGIQRCRIYLEPLLCNTANPVGSLFCRVFFFFCEALEAVGYLITSGSAQISLLMLNPKLAAVANWFLWDCLRCTDIPDTNSIFQRAKET